MAYGGLMPEPLRQIFGYSGVLQGGRRSFTLAEHALSLVPTTSDGPKRVCYIPTAVGDSDAAIRRTRANFVENIPGVEFSVLTLFTQASVPDARSHLLAQDVIFVEGGSVVNLMAVWRVHGLRPILRECWAAGVVLTGVSAGSLCWHLGGPTDSYSDALDPFDDGIGILRYSNGVHDDYPEQPRRETYRRQVNAGTCAPGYASEDGVGLHYIGAKLHEAVTIVAGKTAWWVEPGEATPVPTRLI